MSEPLSSEKRLAMECVALGCQRGVADQLIQELRARIAELELGIAEAKGQIETLDRSNNRLREKFNDLIGQRDMP